MNQTISEKILSAKSGRDVQAGDVAVCRADLVLGTDASAPMAIDYFERMGGSRLFDPSRVAFALDHYSPPSTPQTAAFHDRVRAFARKYGAAVFDVGEGISHQVATERGRVHAGDLVIGADSHTVLCGALGAFATGVGSSDLAAAMITGDVWLRVPETIRVMLSGTRQPGVSAKDVTLHLVGLLGAEGASYQALEFHGTAADAMDRDQRMALCSMGVEMGAKAAVFLGAVTSDADSTYSRTVRIDVSKVGLQVARPHAPDNVAELSEALGQAVQMVFIGTCTGGRASDVRDALEVIEKGGNRLSPGTRLVITPASRAVEQELVADGSLARLEALGATITTPGCGACCGTSGVIPGDGMTVLSTANRNFKARMGNPTAAIYLASPAVCAAAAVTGRITDPRTLRS